MKAKLKNFFKELKQLAKLKPVIFATTAFNLAYGLTNAIISTVELSLFIGITGMYSIIFGIAKLYGLTKFKRIKEGGDGAEIKKTEVTAAKNISVYAAVMSFLHFGFAVVCLFFFEESPSNYHLWFINFIGAAAIVKIITATAGGIRTRKNHSVIIHHLKLMDCANALISLALLQRAILYFTGYEYAKAVAGTGGVFFSLCALLLCLNMFKRLKPSKKHLTQ